MSYNKINYELPGFSGSSKEIAVHSFKGEGKRKAYIQANLHADETPGVLLIHHLLKMLRDADLRGEVLEEVVIVPSANPIGLSQWSMGQMQGRFDKSTGVNFNRDFPSLTDKVAEKIEGKLTGDSDKNIALIRCSIKEEIEGIATSNDSEYLKKLLYSIAFDSDIVLDLHCDADAVCHLYLGTPLWESSKDLPRQMGAHVTMLSKSSGGEPFDEACSKIFWELAGRFPGFPIPSACLSATIELRGQFHVSHEMASKDALNLFSFLVRRGYIKGEAGVLPELINDATPLEGMQQIVADDPGIIVYHKRAGDYVEKDDVVAEIYDPFNDSLKEIRALTEGILFAVRVDRVAHRGLVIGKISGKEPLSKKNGLFLTP